MTMETASSKDNEDEDVILSPRTLTPAEELAALVTDFKTKIDSGDWAPGTRLPTERELEKRLGISRNLLRKGLNQLRAEGKIHRHVGRGTFVTGLAGARGIDTMMEQLGALTTLSEGDSLLGILRAASPADLMEVRLIIEPAVAELAAHRASARQLAYLEECLERMTAASEESEFDIWDGQFHETLVGAARNETLALLYTAIVQARNSPVWADIRRRSVTPERRDLYHRHHRAIFEAVANRDAERARTELHNHLRELRGHLLAA
ncbi:FadR/GntR family transcriptional regulator [Sphingopyxis sp.]|uniref:FadR/GntR family transcriptional regulator n=1 Tax=Sphingopyxis sp. TaxID=1908224 RepID=UPI002DE4E074|nr:FCD domain-containing protein [Sphingopyxis sp.]